MLRCSVLTVAHPAFVTPMASSMGYCAAHLVTPGGVSMPRLGFDRQLRDLQHSILTLGSMGAVAVERAVDALKSRDAALAQDVIDHDQVLDDLASDVEERALLL